MIFNDYEEIVIDSIKVKLPVLSRWDGLFLELLNEKENYILLWETYGEENEEVDEKRQSDGSFWIKALETRN